jgi:hypothetical protein
MNRLWTKVIRLYNCRCALFFTDVRKSDIEKWAGWGERGGVRQRDRETERQRDREERERELEEFGDDCCN